MNDEDVLRAFVEPPLPPSLVDIGRAVRAGQRRQRTRFAAAAVAVVAVVAAGAFATLPVVRGDQAASGHTQITIAATTADGQPASVNDLRSTATVVQNRLRAAGYPATRVSIVDGDLVVVVPGRHSRDEIAPELAPGALAVRKVIEVVPPAIGPATLPPWRAAMPPAGDGQPPSRAQVLAGLGPAVTAANAITDQTEAAADPALEPFRHLSPAEVAVLPPTMQLRVPQIDCSMLGTRPMDAVAAEPGPVVVCDLAGSKYLLDSAKLTGADLASAVARRDPNASWLVDLTFNVQGAPKWTALTAEAYHDSGEACVTTSPRANGDGGSVCQVAFVVDNSVLSAPAIQAVITDPTAPITGGSETDAKQLAAELGGGRVRLALSILSVTSG